jgi:alkylation response protein AidB-like acyl-CoA dehydrogenase
VDLSLNEDQELIKASVEKFIIENYNSENRRKTIKNNSGSDANIWRQFAELGWLGLPFLEKDGGFGGNLMDMNILMESFGKGLVIEPYISTVILSGTILSLCPESKIRSKIISNIISGSNKVSFAYAEPNSRFNVNDVSTTAKFANNEWILNGHKSVVFGAGQSDYILISARTNGNRYEKKGISLFYIAKDAVGLNIQDYPTVDGFKAAEVILDDIHLPNNSLISIENNAFEIIEKTIQKALVSVAAEASGIMSKMYEMTLEYIKTRKQFGVPIGKFQAIQHRTVEMLILSDEMKSLASMAALRSLDTLDGIKSAYASKIHIGIGGRKLGQEAIQLHGGMGVTEEMDISHYFKRITMLDTFLGNSDYYLGAYSKIS